MKVDLRFGLLNQAMYSVLWYLEPLSPSCAVDYDGAVFKSTLLYQLGGIHIAEG
jgi:hypothetical protein